MKFRSIAAGVCLLLGIGAARTSAQDGAAAAKDTTSALRVYIDCQYNCDTNFLRTEMTWVDYMNDRADAQVHVLITGQGTGGGGSLYTINFIGLKEFAAINDTLSFTTRSTDSPDTNRRGLTTMIELGLVHFLARTPLATRMRVSVPAAVGSSEGARAATPTRDPWNYWVFRLNFNGSANGETRSSNKRYSGGISAGRTTEEWKSSVSISSNQSTQSFTYPISETRDTTQDFFSRSSSVYGSLVKSLGANFSAGMTGSLSTSTYGNTKIAWTIQPAVEYDFFPYKEYTRRSLTAQYALGLRHYEYRDTTIYFKTEETHPQHSASLNYSTQEPWGSVYLSTGYSQYLHDRKFYNLGVYGSTNVRLFKGFSFNAYGSYSKVHDQLSLVKGNRTQAEVLLRQRELATDHRYSVSLGLGYRFGSIFNNVVNPRMGGGGGEFFF